MEKLPLEAFPHFKEFEAMYNFLSENVQGVVSFIDCKYFADAFFVAFLQTIAFFIVAARYDTLQKRREFLKKFEEIFVFFEKTYLDKDWEDFRNDLWKLIESEEIKYDDVFPEDLRLDITRCLHFSDLHALKELKKKKNERRAVWSQSVHEELCYDDPYIKVDNVMQKLRRSCQWIYL